ncbi:MAG: response regulator [Treponema sp.]|jgi:putative two-component system response regulator|nr:response regulator [Treponema sp.]
MNQILVVDDNITNLKYIQLQLAENYQVLLAKSGPQALQIGISQLPDLILLDIDMPGMDGFETIRRFRENPLLCRIPVIFLTANHDIALEIKALESGARDFITKPFEKSILLHRVDLHLRFSQYQQHLEDTVKELEDSIVLSFSEIIEARDPNTAGHVRRTTQYVTLLGEELLRRGTFPEELTERELTLMSRAALLHDIGKIGVSDLILLKPGRLDDKEFTVMKTHTTIGAGILQSMYERTPTQHYLRYAKMIAEGHHEKYDGSGYPLGLCGNEIPLCSRIMAVADVYDALVANRVYRKGMSHAEACMHIIDGKNTHFDPRIVDAFEAISEKFAVEEVWQLTGGMEIHHEKRNMDSNALRDHPFSDDFWADLPVYDQIDLP